MDKEHFFKTAEFKPEITELRTQISFSDRLILKTKDGEQPGFYMLFNQDYAIAGKKHKKGSFLFCTETGHEPLTGVTHWRIAG